MKYIVQPFTQLKPPTRLSTLKSPTGWDSPVWFFLSFHLLCWDNCRGVQPRNSRTDKYLELKTNRKLYYFRGHISHPTYQSFLPRDKIQICWLKQKNIFISENNFLAPAARSTTQFLDELWINRIFIWKKKWLFYFNLNITIGSWVSLLFTWRTWENKPIKTKKNKGLLYTGW